MRSIDKQYLDLIQDIYDGNYPLKSNRTGTPRKTTTGRMLFHSFKDNDFPILKVRHTSLRVAEAEQEWISLGTSNINSMLKRDVNIWLDDVIRYNNLLETIPPIGLETVGQYKKRVKDILVQVPSLQNNGFSYPEKMREMEADIEEALECRGIETRAVFTYWDDRTANSMLPPCVYSFQLHRNENKLGMTINMRSTDVLLGLPYNLAGYALRLIYYCLEYDYEPDFIQVFMSEPHIYESHLQYIPEIVENFNAWDDKNAVEMNDKYEVVYYNAPKLNDRLQMFGGITREEFQQAKKQQIEEAIF